MMEIVSPVSWRQLVRPGLAAVVATSLIGLNGGLVAFITWLGMGLLVGLVFGVTGSTKSEGQRRGLGAYNAVAALGCLSVGLDGLPDTFSGLRIAALVMAAIIVGALIRWRMKP